VALPDNAALLAPVPLVITMVTLPLKLETGCPPASRALTMIAGAIGAPAKVVTGCALNASRSAAPATMSNAALVSGLSPLALAESV
jgi:hypothetical protein